jgi:uncharacterized protein YraI
MILGLVVAACGTPAPERGPDNAAIETAVAATLAAEVQVATRVAQALAATQTAQAGAGAAPADTPASVTKEATTPAPGNTPASTAPCTVVANGLNLRAGPGTEFDPPITVLPRGVELNPLGRNAAGTWIQVQIARTTRIGWASSDPRFVSCTVDLAGLPVLQAPPTPTVAPSTPSPTLASTATSTASPSPTATPTITLTPAPPTPTPPQLVVEPIEGSGNWLAQILHPDYFPAATSELMFQVRAYDGNVGTRDGDGIEYVDFFIFDGQGEQVYQKRETQASFCAFGGDDPICRPFVFAHNNYRWPDGGPPIESDFHTLRVEVQGQDGNSRQGEVTFRIEVPYQPPQENLVARIVQIGPGTTASVVSDALVFQVEAYDPAVGNRDGAGIANVNMFVIDDQESVVYQSTEQRAGYCLFGGGDPDCNVWVFADHDHQWPNDQPITSGIYTLRAIVNAQDGRRTAVETGIQIQLP